MERLSFLLKQAFALMDEATERELAQLSVNAREFAVLTLVDAEGAASFASLTATEAAAFKQTLQRLAQAPPTRDAKRRARD